MQQNVPFVCVYITTVKCTVRALVYTFHVFSYTAIVNFIGLMRYRYPLVHPGVSIIIHILIMHCNIG